MKTKTNKLNNNTNFALKSAVKLSRWLVAVHNCPYCNQDVCYHFKSENLNQPNEYKLEFVVELPQMVFGLLVVDYGLVHQLQINLHQ